MEACLRAWICYAGSTCDHRLRPGDHSVVADRPSRIPRRSAAADCELAVDHFRNYADQQSAHGDWVGGCRSAEPCSDHKMECPSLGPNGVGGSCDRGLPHRALVEVIHTHRYSRPTHSALRQMSPASAEDSPDGVW